MIWKKYGLIAIFYGSKRIFIALKMRKHFLLALSDVIRWCYQGIPIVFPISNLMLTIVKYQGGRVTIGKYVAGYAHNNKCTNLAQNLLNRL